MTGTPAETADDANSIRLVLDGEIRTVAGVAPTRSVLAWLREDLGRTGTKEGCAEGDCGACTVVVGELDGDRVRLRTVNACIQFVPALDGRALFTVESLKGAGGALHPAQQAMVDCHGSQCGFCTPGFVMSLWNVYADHRRAGARPDDGELRTALSGNLCRCTGYRPILEAGARMFELPEVRFDEAALAVQLASIRRTRALHYAHAGSRFHAPRTLAELRALRAERPAATIVAGCTDVGLWVNKQLRELPELVYVGEVAELKTIGESAGWLRIGAAVALTDAYAAIVRHYPQMRQMWERFASVPVRNAGTLGGNVANGSPIGDSMPGLIALGGRVVLSNRERARTLPLEDLYVAYMKKSMGADEIVEAVEVPLPRPGWRFRTYKLSKRYDSDISAVCAAFAIRCDGRRIEEARVAFGGMAATPKRAAAAEAALAGRAWNEATVRAAMAALSADYAPLTDMRASAAYRSAAARNLLYRFFLETREVDPLPAGRVSVYP
jgi:xanthine dehydrogenase small subunit